VLDGYTSDESAKDEDATSHDDYEEMFQSTNVEDPISPTVYDAYDVDSLNVITPMLYDDSSHLSYDVVDDEDVIAPRQGLEDQ
jgi:hypothetical protein